MADQGRQGRPHAGVAGDLVSTGNEIPLGGAGRRHPQVLPGLCIVEPTAQPALPQDEIRPHRPHQPLLEPPLWTMGLQGHESDNARHAGAREPEPRPNFCGLSPRPRLLFRLRYC